MIWENGPVMKITLCGKSEEVENGMTVTELLQLKAIDPAAVVVEINLDIIEKGKYDDTRINENDTIEIVRFVGGG